MLKSRSVIALLFGLGMAAVLVTETDAAQAPVNADHSPGSASSERCLWSRSTFLMFLREFGQGE